MVFARLDGFEIPVEADRADVTPVEIGEFSRGFDGTALQNRRARKRRFRLPTTIVTELVAKAIEGVAVGLGQAFAYDWQDDNRTQEDFFSSKGLTPGATVGGQRWGIAADGVTVVNEGGVVESQFGSGSLELARATTNILDQNKRDGSEDGTTTGFAATFGSALASITTARVQGTRSLQATTPGSITGEGVETTPQTASASTTYVGSVYVKTDTAGDYVFRLLDEIIGTIASETIALVTGEWKRVEITGTTSAGASQITLVVQTDFTGVVVIQIDALQIETGSVATTWADGLPAFRADAPHLDEPGCFTVEGVKVSFDCSSTGPRHCSSSPPMLLEFLRLPSALGPLTGRQCCGNASRCPWYTRFVEPKPKLLGLVAESPESLLPQSRRSVRRRKL